MRRTSKNSLFLSLISLLILFSCTSGSVQNPSSDESIAGKEAPPGTPVNDLLIADCLLPGKMIQIGQFQQWQSPPRPARIPAWECKLGGGQYALNGDSLSIWRDSASKGDKVAQNYVGEIYLVGFGIPVDYPAAADWFRKSAEQGFRRAQNNLGFLYEKGLGVPKDPQKALNYYREANGLVEPIDVDQATNDEISALQAKLSKAEQETENLQKELWANTNALKQKQEEIDRLGKQRGLHKQLKALQKDYDQVKVESQSLRKQLSDSQNNLTQVRGQTNKIENDTALNGNSFKGRYFALIIGINDYQDSGLKPLKTAVNDAKGIEQVLKQKYGFQTTLVTDNQATQEGIYEALAKIKGMMNENDNFLIYYAGHGSKENNSFHWIPSDAKQSNEWSKISTDDITRQIDPKSLKAKHVLIIADSCFAGLLAVDTRSSIIDTLALSDKLGWINKKYGLVSRNLLASGGDEPVLDTESKNGQSIFANALVELLTQQDGIISANDVYQTIGSKVESFARSRALSQAPVYRPLSGDEFGEFFFIPRNLQRVAEIQKEQSQNFSFVAMSDQKSLQAYISVNF